MEEIKYTAISLFSGLGGDCLGMTQAGCNVIAYNELKPTFCKSHNENFTDCELICDGKITDISKLKDACFLKYKDKTDILFAGFPCQGFSNAGKKKDDDPRNTLFLEFLRVTKLVNPYMIIGENVKGLLTKKTSNNELYIDVIVSEFQKLGYDVIHQVFKTEQYNVPQKRERLIILGIKKENPYGWVPSFPEPSLSKPNLLNIVNYDMTGSIKVDSTLFDNIPDECILTNMSDNNPLWNNGAHPYLLSKLYAKENDMYYNDKQYSKLCILYSIHSIYSVYSV
jgi:DNA (cytosine-5)-methyltransferase 1